MLAWRTPHSRVAGTMTLAAGAADGPRCLRFLPLDSLSEERYLARRATEQSVPVCQCDARRKVHTGEPS